MFTKSSAAWCGPDLDSIGNMGNLVCLWEDDLRPGIQFARHIWRLYHRTYETPGIRDFPAWLISRRHSVGSLRTGDHPHPIVVKFVSYRAREGIWGQKKTSTRSIYSRRPDASNGPTELSVRETRLAGELAEIWTHDGKVFIKLLDSGCLYVVRSFESLLECLSLEDSVSVRRPELLNYSPRKQSPSNPHIESVVYHNPTTTNTHQGQLGLSDPMVYISFDPHYKIIDI